MSFSEDQSFNSKKTDFDDSDEDLGSLLADDDDDIFSKQKFSKTTSKKTSNSGASPSKSSVDHSDGKFPVRKVSISNVNNSNDATKFSYSNKNSPKHLVSKSKELFEDKEVLNELKFDSSSPAKEKRSSMKSKDGIFDEEEDYLNDLKMDELSFVSTKNLSDDSFTKPKKSLEDDDDILKDLESKGPVAPSSAKRKSSSFLDDFLSKQSPKHSGKISSNVESSKSVDKQKFKDSAEEERDILGSYMPSSSKKQNQGTFDEATSSSSSRRGSLFKQVSFKEDSELSPIRKASSMKTATSEVSFKGELSEPKSLEPPKKDNALSKPNFETKSDKNSAQSRRSEKMKSSGDDETDWLNFFKGSPKKSSNSKPSEQAGSNVTPKRDAYESAPGLNARRSSGAEWLGLNESKFDVKESVTKSKPTEETDWQDSGDSFIHSRPKTAGDTPARSKQKSVNPPVDASWLNNNFEKDSARTIPFMKENVQEMSSVAFYSEKSSIKDVLSTKTDQLSRNTRKEELKHQQPEFQEANNVTHEYMTSKQTQNPLQMLPINENLPYGIKVPQENASLNSSGFHGVPIDSYQYLQTKLTECILEKDQLAKSCENLKFTFEEKIKAMETVHRNQLSSSNDSSKIKENSLKAEFEAKLESLEEKTKLLDNEKKQLQLNYKSKLEAYEEQHKKEIFRIKDLHNHAVELMKQDHEDALTRLKRLKEQEIEAILSTQTHSRSLQHLSDQLEARAAELASLQAKIEGKSQATFLEKQALLESKEKELKALQNRLQKQLDDGEEERTRLQQLVLRLESRLQKNTIEGEEDRWEVQQLKSKLTVQQKHMEEEHKLQQQQIEKEKEKLRSSQDNLLHEQKMSYLQLAQEREQLSREKAELSSLTKKLKEDEAKLNVQKLKEESIIEVQKRALQQDESKLYFEKEQVRQTTQQLEREQEQLQRERQQLKDEREKISSLQSTLRKKTQDMEEMTLRITEEKEHCRLEREIAQRIKTEHQSRLQHYAQQMQMIMDKERQILMEKEKLTEEKIELENKKNSMLCNRCKISAELPVNSHYGINAVAPVVQATMAPAPLLNGLSSNAQLLSKDPSLVVWYVSAQRDREFLQDELAFLQSLKESSKNKKS